MSAESWLLDGGIQLFPWQGAGVGSGHPEVFFLGQVLQRLCCSLAEMLCEQKRSALRGHSMGWIWCPAGLGAFHTVVLEETLESPLDCKKIKPVNHKRNQPLMFNWKD